MSFIGMFAPAPIPKNKPGSGASGGATMRVTVSNRMTVVATVSTRRTVTVSTRVTTTVSALGAGTSFRIGMLVAGFARRVGFRVGFLAWAPAVMAPPRVMAAARPSAYNAEFRVFILVLRRRRPVVWFPAGEVAGATRVVAF